MATSAPDTTRLDALARASESAAARLDELAERATRSDDRRRLVMLAAWARTVPTLTRAAVDDLAQRPVALDDARDARGGE